MRLSTVLLLAALSPEMAYGWGFDGHRRLARHMQDPLPDGHCLRAFIQANQTFAFQDMSADPDRWRHSSHPGYDPNEWPRHYLEIDWETPIERYPREWALAQARFGQYAERNGKVPWRVEEYYAKLVEAFRSGDSARLLTTLAHFSHYVSDAFSVLHDTKNFDPNGLHARWESDMLQVRANIDGIAALSASYLGKLGRAHPRHAIFDIVIVGNGLLPQLLAADQAAHDGGSFDMQKFYESVKDLTARRWGDALTLLASLVASAWLDAGKPMLPGMPADCSTDVPQTEVVLKGFPVPGGWYQPPPDAGEVGGDGGDGSSGFDAGPPPNPPVEAPPESCGGCGGAAFLAWPALLAFARVRSWLTALVLVLTGCRDEGTAEYQSAAARYERLLASGRPPGDAEFDEVLRALERIPPSSSARARAEALSRAIERARAKRAPRPLSRRADGAECTHLAEALGRATGGEREDIERRLEACRAQGDGHAH